MNQDQRSVEKRPSWVAWAMIALLAASPFWSVPIAGVARTIGEGWPSPLRLLLGVAVILASLVFGRAYVQGLRRAQSDFATFLFGVAAVVLVSLGIVVVLFALPLLSAS